MPADEVSPAIGGSVSRMESASRAGPRRPFSHEHFASIVAPLFESLVSVARKVLKSDDMARDAVQEAALSLWLEPEWPPNPRAWLIRTVVHRSLHLARTRARRQKYEARACRERLETCDRDDPSQLLESQDLFRELVEALEDITPEHRHILVLKVIEEWDYESIAARLQIPIGTVRSRLNRSRRAFRKSVERILPEECAQRVKHKKQAP
ncbi:RNA polymerase sigma factor [Singulisphaera acidiphila]|nr:RNA polymerase sigma factor [Singulisphaera acidiphila]